MTLDLEIHTAAGGEVLPSSVEHDLATAREIINRIATGNYQPNNEELVLLAALASNYIDEIDSAQRGQENA